MKYIKQKDIEICFRLFIALVFMVYMPEVLAQLPSAPEIPNTNKNDLVGTMKSILLIVGGVVIGAIVLVATITVFNGALKAYQEVTHGVPGSSWGKVFLAMIAGVAIIIAGVGLAAWGYDYFSNVQV